MKKEVTLKEWLDIAHSLAGLVALSVRSDDKLLLEDAVNAFISLSTCLLNNVDINL